MLNSIASSTGQSSIQGSSGGEEEDLRVNDFPTSNLASSEVEGSKVASFHSKSRMLISKAEVNRQIVQKRTHELS